MMSPVVKTKRQIIPDLLSVLFFVVNREENFDIDTKKVIPSVLFLEVEGISSDEINQSLHLSQGFLSWPTEKRIY